MARRIFSLLIISANTHMYWRWNQQLLKPQLRSLETSSLLKELNEHWYTDNGLPFNSTEFKQFSQQRNFQHITCSPNIPQFDGQAEQAVQTIKQRMLRCKQDSQDWQIHFLNWDQHELPRTFQAQQKSCMEDLQGKSMDKHHSNRLICNCQTEVRTLPRQGSWTTRGTE